MRKLVKKIAGGIINDDARKSLHRVEASLAAARNGWPAKKLIIIGVTGTNGKTSVCHYITQLLQESGKKVGMLTTVAISIDGKRELNTSKMTTLDSSKLQGYLKQMVDAGCTHAVVETTSHALDQNRVHGLYYDTVVFTNLTHEHLDYHKSMGEYQKAKEKLFANRPRVSVINGDDPAAPSFLKYPASRKYTFGINDAAKPKHALDKIDIVATQLKTGAEGTSFELSTPLENTSIVTPLMGRFTIANILASIGVALEHGVTMPQIKETLKHLTAVEGRLEPVDAGQPFSVIVDFAHTPDALQQVYSSLRPLVKGRLIAVLGSMGDRDKTKRPILGSLASRFADYVIVTNEDPATEDPMSIINEVAGGIPSGRPNKEAARHGEGEWWWRIPDRRDGIAKALGLAKAGDTVIITGKGGEHVMLIGEKLIPWNDVKVVKEILSK